jgi:DNA helicase II / ATP-dependent DNA helicase PcrA
VRPFEVVYGPPGSGKTTLLASRIADFVDAGHNATEILFVSFTRTGAKEILSRMDLGIEARTLHSYAFGALGMASVSMATTQKMREFGRKIGLEFDSDDGISDGARYRAVLDYARSTHMDIGAAYARLGSPGVRARFMFFVSMYDKWKAAHGFLDFTDLLTRFNQSPSATNHRILVVDEAQDFTPLQWEVVDNIIGVTQPEQVIIAGDDDQAIFTWAGADPHGMEKFASRWGAKSTTIPVSHRLGRAVHELAHSIVTKISHRVDKKYEPLNGNGSVTKTSSVHTADLSVPGSMVLARTHYLLRDIEAEIVEQAIPYTKLGGGMMDNRAGRAITLMRKIAAGKTPTMAECDRLARVVKPKYARDVNIGEFGFCEEPIKALHLRPDQDRYYRRVDWDTEPVHLMTIHSAKGMEADRVVLLGEMTEEVERGFNVDPDAEHRVFYTGVTRAKQELCVIGGNYPAL